jgi:ATP-dependent helicase/nuclease subunit A
MTVVIDRSDEESRRLIEFAVDETLVVEAAAGTGKTTELVKRILRVIATGRAGVDRIVAVTFTEKAAGELKLRLRQELERARTAAADPAVIARLDAAIQHLEEAHVSTIHGFCADLLRERPVEARIDPMFRVLTEGQAQRLFDGAFDHWLQQQLEDPPEGVRRSLRRASRGFRPGDVDEDGPIERLRRAAWDLTEWRDFRGPWVRDPFDRAGAIERLIELVHACADLSQHASYAGDNLSLDTEPVRRLSRDLRAGWDPAVPDLRPPIADLDGLESQLIELRRNRDFRRARKGSGPTYAKGVTRAQVLAARDALIEALAEFQVKADADLAAVLHRELFGCVDGYERLKAREGVMDFLDLLLRARDLIANDEVVRRHFQGRFTRIFVDEFQDTDPLQAELLLLLAADDPGETRWESVIPSRGKLFVVGDPKQSIYRFRRADVDIYLRVRQQLIHRGAIALELRRSFRSVPNIQRAVNATFAPIMNGNPGALQAGYVALEPWRDELPGQPSLVALPVPDPYSHRFVTAKKIEQCLPDAVGAYVDWLVRHSRWTVTERHNADTPVPIEARHICILFRRFVSYGADVTRPYVDALEARGIRHLLVGGRAFHNREEIETLRSALMAIEWPEDQLSVFATLRGSLFAIGDEELLEYHHAARGFHPFRIPASLPSHLEPVRDALALLAGLHRERNRRPVADTISTLLGRTRAHVGFVLRPAGEQALANVLHVAELARQYEIDGGLSFRGFVDTLQAEASARQAPEAPILEEGSDGVRLMTVHKAKGLEFPIVILADITARLTPHEAGRHIDARRKVCALRIGGWSPQELNDQRDNELAREKAEGERVAYVAATRARDLLVVPAVGDEPYTEGWIAPLSGAVYPQEDVRRVQTAARGCPDFKSKDTVLMRPDGDPASMFTVCPGEHRLGPRGAEFSVVWWAPDELVLGAQASLGLRRDDLIVKSVDPAVLRQRLDAYQQWRTARDSAVNAAARPSIEVLTATEFADRSASRASEPTDGRTIRVDVIDVATPDGRRAGGARFGTLVHAVLASVPLTRTDEHSATHLAETHGRVLGATADEIASAGAVVRTVVRHPVLTAAMRAAALGKCYRETPVTLRLDDGSLVEGNVDLAYIDDEDVVVVDFKTDRELEGAIETYRRQVQVYAAAIASALGRPARAVLMRV